ncbi:MAG: TIGR02757 family protein [Treponema sp.]|nr:TIGR02757 family protein [Treponema sp.]
MDSNLKDRLAYLADKYERPDFLSRDPSCFMHRYQHREDQEIVAFIASSLAFGRREQILSHVETILDFAGKSPSDWIVSGLWDCHFPDSPASFYRTYSYAAVRSLFATLQKIMQEKSLGDYFKEKWLEEQEGETGQKEECRHLCQLISRFFPAECSLIPHSADCAFKKINMFLRWMVRDSSPVDLGLWSSWYSKADLLVPLDTHVMQESTRLGLLSPSASGKVRAATLKCAFELTEKMAEIFPGDPSRGDYALFGLGVDG